MCPPIDANWTDDGEAPGTRWRCSRYSSSLDDHRLLQSNTQARQQHSPGNKRLEAKRRITVVKKKRRRIEPEAKEQRQETSRRWKKNVSRYSTIENEQDREPEERKNLSMRIRWWQRVRRTCQSSAEMIYLTTNNIPS